ncbi:MAG: hypothetical protein GX609_04015, partial [Actinomycetales bacterium]|nr:hypothetical protein [Actinomycetales bacterium]
NGEVELAFRARAASGTTGTIRVDLASAQGATTWAETTVTVGSLPACAPSWQWLKAYGTGDVVSYGSWNWVALRPSILNPPSWQPRWLSPAWERVEPCA